MLEPQTVIAVAGAVVAALSALLTYWATRGKTRTDAKTALDARIDARVNAQLDGAWKDIDRLKSAVSELTEKDRMKSAAFARILRAIANQWPTAHGPDLDPSDIALIEDTIPPTWLRRGGDRKESS